MARSHLPDHREQTRDSEALRMAEKRAKNAEHRVDELEHRLQNLENENPETAQRPVAVSSQIEIQQTNAGIPSESDETEALRALRKEPMMDHLLNALDRGEDIGHYGRLVFAMVAHHFLSEDAMSRWLTKDRGINKEEAGALLRQVEGRDYNPPRRDRILAWQSQQDFPILPSPDDPDCGNVYRNLKFPQSVYQHIEEYQEEELQARNQAADREDSK